MISLLAFKSRLFRIKTVLASTDKENVANIPFPKTVNVFQPSAMMPTSTKQKGNQQNTQKRFVKAISQMSENRKVFKPLVSLQIEEKR